jgi:hypothetical protein
MNGSDRLEDFAREFPFPWSVGADDSPGRAPRTAHRSHVERRRAEPDRELLSLETFLDRYRRQMTLQTDAEQRPAQPQHEA